MYFFNVWSVASWVAKVVLLLGRSIKLAQEARDGLLHGLKLFDLRLELIGCFLKGLVLGLQGRNRAMRARRARSRLPLLGGGVAILVSKVRGMRPAWAHQAPLGGGLGDRFFAAGVGGGIFRRFALGGSGAGLRWGVENHGGGEALEALGF